MGPITNDELQKACDIATDYGHQQLADLLLQMVAMHSMSYGLVSRAGEQPQHVEEYYTAIGKLDKGGSTPTGRLSVISLSPSE